LAESKIHSLSLHNNPVLVINGPFHEGIIGIVAGRISEKYRRPSIVITDSGKGSARSGPNDFSIVDAIASCSKHLIRFGGHKAAAGLSIEPASIDLFAKDIQHTFAGTPSQMSFHYYDLMLPVQNFPHTLTSELRLLEPTGLGNLPPCFYSPQTTVEAVLNFGRGNEHVKFMIESKEALLFSASRKMKSPEKVSRFSFLYSPFSKQQFLVHEVDPCT
jgi:single-stranded-DNA-specific exonuclease